MSTTSELWQRFQLPGTPENPVKGPAIASAAEISITHPVHEVTGTTQVTDMNPPYVGFVGEVTLIWTNANPGGVGTGGSTGTDFATALDPAQNTFTKHFYDGTKWYNQDAA